MTLVSENTTQMKAVCQCRVSDEDMSRKVLPCILDIGECLMTSGADVNHVERLLVELGTSYGAYKMNVLVFTSSIVVTMTLSDGREYTQTRRIEGSAITDFYKLERLNKLCRKIEKAPLPASELKQEFMKIKNEDRPRSWHYAGGIIGVSSYTAFFGGTPLEILISAIFAAFLCFLMERFQPYTPNQIGFNVFSSAIIGLLIGLTCNYIPGINADVLIIGEIMLLIPGLAMTNAIRDMFSGDTLSGILRFIESLLWTGALVLGFMASLWLLGSVVHTNLSNVSYLTKLITVIPASLGFLIFYNSRKRLMLLGLVGGFLTYLVFVLSINSGMQGNFAPALVASIFASIYAEFLSKKLHVPSAVFFIIAVLPIIPGRYLFSAMNYFVQGFWVQAGDMGIISLEYSIAIAIAICLVWTVSRTWRNLHIKSRITSLVEKRI